VAHGVAPTRARRDGLDGSAPRSGPDPRLLTAGRTPRTTPGDHGHVSLAWLYPSDAATFKLASPALGHSNGAPQGAWHRRPARKSIHERCSLNVVVQRGPQMAQGTTTTRMVAVARRPLAPTDRQTDDSHGRSAKGAGTRRHHGHHLRTGHRPRRHPSRAPPASHPPAPLTPRPRPPTPPRHARAHVVGHCPTPRPPSSWSSDRKLSIRTHLMLDSPMGSEAQASRADAPRPGVRTALRRRPTGVPRRGRRAW
jgi:hypothetical protein